MQPSNSTDKFISSNFNFWISSGLHADTDYIWKLADQISAVKLCVPNVNGHFVRKFLSKHKDTHTGSYRRLHPATKVVGNHIPDY